jgi:ribonuclease R
VQGVYRAILMTKHVGEELEGEVTGVAVHGVVVTLDSPFVEVKIPIERIGEDWFELDRLGLALVGQRSGRRIALADRARVRIDEASIERRETVGTLLSGGTEGRAEERSRRGRRTRDRVGTDGGKPRGERGARTGTLPRGGKSGRGAEARGPLAQGARKKRR